MNNRIYKYPHQKTLLAWAGELAHLLVGGLLGCMGVTAIALAAHYLGISTDVFTREPQVALGGAWYTGSFSNLGGLIWFATAGVVSFAALFKSKARTSLVMVALLTWAMGVDDVFMLHDYVYPRLRIREIFVYAAYFSAAVLIALRFHAQLERSTLIGVTGTVFFWGLSALFDKFFNAGIQLTEDGAKFIGITVWAATWIYQAHASLRPLTYTTEDTGT